MIFVRIEGVGGDPSIKTEGYSNPNKPEWFIAESFGFGVEREMKESGEKGGTSDINIGVGELQECTISKSMDMASIKLCQFAINGNSPGACEIHFVEVAGGASASEARPTCYLAYKLDRCFVKSWSTSGDADDRPTEEVAFYYNRIAFNYAMTPDGREWKHDLPMKWDNTTQSQWTSGCPTFNFKEKDGGWKIS